jgi:hypothetical protein
VVSIEKGNRSNLHVERGWSWPRSSDGTVINGRPSRTQIGHIRDQTGTNSLLKALSQPGESS